MYIIETDSVTPSHKNRSIRLMSSFSLSTPHTDYIHDIRFDSTGRRLATCSGDCHITIYNLDEAGNWVLKTGCEWRAHKGVVWRLCWSHPEFGSVLASASADKSVCIWEEQEGGFENNSNNTQKEGEKEGTEEGGKQLEPGAAITMAVTSPQATQQQQRWVLKATLTEARKGVNCVEFAPRHNGLRLATGSADGQVRIYEAIDVMSLNHWPMSQSFEADAAVSSELGVTALSWNGGRFEAPMLVVGGSSGRVTIWRWNESKRQWGADYELVPHGRGVLDVSWAPNVGRSYHLIASAGKDGVCRIHRLKRTTANVTAGQGGKDANEKTSTVDEVVLAHESAQELDLSGGQEGGNDVWRLSWNATGTVLSTSGDDGRARLWKADWEGHFKVIEDSV